LPALNFIFICQTKAKDVIVLSNNKMFSFDPQFNTKKRLDFHSRSISFVDVIPPIQKNNIPIFIAPGWGETPKTFKDLMRLLFDAGFRVISVTHPRQDLKLITKSNISKLEFQKAEIILSIFDFLNIRKVNVVAHSEGAINAVIAAHLQPTIFNDMLLVGPGGLVENEGFFELASRFIGNMIQGDDIVFPLKKMKSLSDLPWIDFHSIDGDHSDIYAHSQKYVVFLQKRFTTTSNIH